MTAPQTHTQPDQRLYQIRTPPTRSWRKHTLCMLTGILAVTIPTLSEAAITDSIGRVIIARGEVTALREQNTPDEVSHSTQDTVPLKRRSPIFQTDTLITGHNGQTQVRFTDGGLLALSKNSRLDIQHYQANETGPDVVMELIEGGFRTLTGTLGKHRHDAYEVKTPVGTIGIRGTLYSALLHKGQLLLGTWQGQIEVDTMHGAYQLGVGADFNFAAVTASGFTGMLEPPIQLQPATQSSVPASSPREEDSDNADEEEGASSKVVISPMEREEDSDSASTFQSGNQLSDNQHTTDTSDVSPDVRLTSAEYRAFLASDQLGGVVAGNTLRVGTAFDGSNQEPVFVTLDESGNLDVIRFSGISSDREQPSAQFDVEWGIWNGTNLTPIEVYGDRHSDHHTNLTEQALWLTGTPTRSADIAGLTGTVSFSGTDAIGFNQDGAALNTASGSFDLNLDTGDITNGQLMAGFDTSNNANSGMNDVWELSFDGSIQTGDVNTAVADLDIIEGQHNEIGLNLDGSQFNGLLIGDQAEGFVGGFYLIDNQNNTANGAVLLQQ